MYIKLEKFDWICHFFHRVKLNICKDRKLIQNEGYLWACLLRATLAFPSWLCVNVFYFLLIHRA